jgi:hypothetical protein
MVDLVSSKLKVLLATSLRPTNISGRTRACANLRQVFGAVLPFFAFAFAMSITENYWSSLAKLIITYCYCCMLHDT